jgi:putative transposon-encoded protein
MKRNKTRTKFRKELRIKGVCGLLERKVTSFGTGAKVDCLKEYIGKKVYLIIVEDDSTAGVK